MRLECPLGVLWPLEGDDAVGEGEGGRESEERNGDAWR